MTLTEQLKKGELESGKEYWVRLTDEWKNSTEQVYFNGEDFERFDIDDIEEVLAPIPSYEELKELKIDNHNLKAWIKNFQPKYKEMEKENTQLHKFLEEFNALDVAKENQQLKELLKECLNEIHELAEIQDNRSVTIYNFLSAELITKIDNAIGEKK